MSLEAESKNWFALQVRTRWEASTSLLLEGKGYRTLLPTYKMKKRWNGKLRESVSPLFPGYVFCHFNAQNRLPILITPGVLAVVGRGRVPVPVDDAEINAIESVVTSGLTAEPWPYLELGQRVRIESESLEGLEGILIQFRGHDRIVLSVTLLRRSVCLEIDRLCVKPVNPPRAVALSPIASRPVLQGLIA